MASIPLTGGGHLRSGACRIPNRWSSRKREGDAAVGFRFPLPAGKSADAVILSQAVQCAALERISERNADVTVVGGRGAHGRPG